MAEIERTLAVVERTSTNNLDKKRQYSVEFADNNPRGCCQLNHQVFLLQKCNAEANAEAKPFMFSVSMEETSNGTGDFYPCSKTSHRP